MDFTREPVIETIISPREGHRLVVRSSKNSTQEEYFVEAVEVVSFGSSCFFRSKEKPKPFLVPVSDYEVVEVREQRLVIKARAPEGGSIKIAGGRESRNAREETRREERKQEGASEEKERPEGKTEGRFERKKERRNRFRRGRKEEEGTSTPSGENEEAPLVQEHFSEEEFPLPPFKEEGDVEMLKPKEKDVQAVADAQDMPMFRTVLPPPTTLIRDDLQRLRETASQAFYTRAEDEEIALPKEEEKKEVPPQEGTFCPPPSVEGTISEPPSEDFRP